MRSVHRALELALAAVAAAAIVAQFLHSTYDAGAPVANFFSFFTIESNLIVIASLIVPWPPLRGAATVYIVIVGIVYSALLANKPDDVTLPWVNVVLHYISPAALAIDWLVVPPAVRGRIPTLVIAWLAYPSLYLAYTLVRGAIVGWYPYPFVNPANSSYATVAIVCAAIALFAAVVSVILLRYARRRTATA